VETAVFMDRDGTLMVDVGYCSSADEVHLLPGVKENLHRLKAQGLKLVIVTNQSGIGRGYFAEADFWIVQRKFEEKIGPGVIDATYFCPDRPEEPTERRKPAPGMLLEAARDLSVDLKSSFMIGDQSSDVEAGIRAGVKAAILIHPDGTRSTPQSGAAFVAPDFAETTKFILEQLSPNAGPKMR
jgi:D-glycero-D-manno-heptose 1,7-bisphosphate phosphatase